MLVEKWDIHYFDEVESTNLIVKKRIKGDGPSGFVAVAKKQTGGKGMRGHSWCSPEGGLYFSLLLNTSLASEKLPEIPLRIATVVLEALQPLSSKSLTIKPSNDIVIESSLNHLRNDLSEGNQCEGLTDVDRSATSGPLKVEKLVGISTELYMQKLCVGVGVNIFHPEKEFEIEGINIPVYLEDFATQKLSIDLVLKTVLSALNAKLRI